jgi:DnaD/phage-associated family protein
MQLNSGRCEDKPSDLKMDGEQLRRAMIVLQKLGLAETEGTLKAQPGDKRPDYAQSDLTENLTGDSTFKQLAEDVSQKLGKILSNTDLTVLLGIYDWLGLPADVISLLVVYCMEESRKKYGEGRPPTLRAIEKTALIWEKEGLITAERAESWMLEREKTQNETTKIARILQISGRTPTSTEESYIRQWAMMGFSPEVIYDAYDKTVTRCGRLEWKYLHTILKSWHEKGVKTLDDIDSRDKKAAPPGRAASGKLSDFELEALKRMEKYDE